MCCIQPVMRAAAPRTTPNAVQPVKEYSFPTLIARQTLLLIAWWNVAANQWRHVWWTTRHQLPGISWAVSIDLLCIHCSRKLRVAFVSGAHMMPSVSACMDWNDVNSRIHCTPKWRRQCIASAALNVCKFAPFQTSRSAVILVKPKNVELIVMRRCWRHPPRMKPWARSSNTAATSTHGSVGFLCSCPCSEFQWKPVGFFCFLAGNPMIWSWARVSFLAARRATTAFLTTVCWRFSCLL